MRRYTERHTNDRERHAGKRKRKAFVDLRAAGAALALVLAFLLLKQLLDRQRRAAGPFLLFLVQLFKADGQRAFHHVDAVADLVETERILGIALLITCLIQVHQDLLVRQISFQHPGAGVGDFHRERTLVHLEHGDVLELVAFFFADVNPPARELIDHLIASEERHRVARCKIENGAAQPFLRSGRHVHIEPETNHRATERDRREWNANTCDAHAIGAQRDQFVVRREPSEHEQDRGQQSPRDRENERERQHVRNERDQVFHRHIVIHQQRQQLAKNISDNEDQTQHRDREYDVHQQLAANKSIDQLHFPAETLAQKDRDAAIRRLESRNDSLGGRRFTVDGWDAVTP